MIPIGHLADEQLSTLTSLLVHTVIGPADRAAKHELGEKAKYLLNTHLNLNVSHYSLVWVGGGGGLKSKNFRRKLTWV